MQSQEGWKGAIVKILDGDVEEKGGREAKWAKRLK
jgi:hypothetical protein